MIANCKVVGTKSDEFGQVPVAHIVLKEEFESQHDYIKLQIIEAFRHSIIAPFSWPADYIFWKADAFPLTSGAKKDNALALADFGVTP